MHCIEVTYQTDPNGQLRKLDMQPRTTKKTRTAADPAGQGLPGGRVRGARAEALRPLDRLREKRVLKRLFLLEKRATIERRKNMLFV